MIDTAETPENRLNRIERILAITASQEQANTAAMLLYSRG